MQTFLLVVIWFSILVGYSQDSFVGSWKGVLKIQGAELPIIWNVQKEGTAYKTTMDSPAQSAFHIPVAETKVAGDSIFFNAPNIMLRYRGLLKNNMINGEFTQNGMRLPLNLTPGKSTAPKRPQTPQAPFPYSISKHQIKTGIPEVTLGATLTVPKGDGPFPAVILVSGSGPQDRDQTLFNHKSFWVLADYLSRNGISVLRYDDRGVAQTTGSFTTATSIDFSKDAQSALQWLEKQPKINPEKTGVIGHSEGGLIASILGSNQSEVDFIVLMAAPGLPGYILLQKQTADIAWANGMPETAIEEAVSTNKAVYEIAVTAADFNTFSTNLKENLNNHPKLASLNTEQRSLIANQMNNPWMFTFLRLDPRDYLQNTTCPVLALNGELDLQVNANDNLRAIESALKAGKNPPAKIINYQNLNHLFQTATTGLPAEYSTIEETISPQVLEHIADWISSQ